MDKKTEALKLAQDWYDSGNENHDDFANMIKQVIALAEQPAQQQEPFGHVTVRRLSQRFENHHDQYHFYPAGQSPYLDNVDECHAVYTSPQPAQQEPVCDKDPRGCWSVRCQLGKVCKNTSPQSKPWVGLTLDEKHALNDALNLNGRFAVIDTIEAKLKEKNA